MSDFSREMERRLHAFGNDVQNLVRKMTDVTTTGGFVPAVDICETEDEYKVYADIPGLSKDEINLTVHENIVTIKGERLAPDASGITFAKQERPVGPFSRSLSLPDYVDTKDVKASFRKGVLEITFPKKVSGNSENSIEIE